MCQHSHHIFYKAVCIIFIFMEKIRCRGNRHKIIRAAEDLMLCGDDGCFIDRLDRVHVDHADLCTGFFFDALRRFQRKLYYDAAADIYRTVPGKRSLQHLADLISVPRFQYGHACHASHDGTVLQSTVGCTRNAGGIACIIADQPDVQVTVCDIGAALLAGTHGDNRSHCKCIGHESFMCKPCGKADQVLLCYADI